MVLTVIPVTLGLYPYFSPCRGTTELAKVDVCFVVIRTKIALKGCLLFAGSCKTAEYSFCG